MPANRSRTTEWRRCLQQLLERNGALEIAVARDYEKDGEHGRHLVWRVRILGGSDQELLVEQPSTLGQEIELHAGIELVVVMAIGQNRWMFRTRNLGQIAWSLNERKTTSALRLAMPTSVERCQRRNYYRVETVTLTLPLVEMWPLMDPKSVLLAERANEIEFQANDMDDAPSAAGMMPLHASSGEPGDAGDAMLPEVGPKFAGTLLNLGGGGMGVLVGPESSQPLSRYKLFWIRFALPPELATPICATGKVVHTHMDSMQQTYAGVAFDFSFNPGHQRFVVDQICRYIAIQQRAQLARQAALEASEDTDEAT